jgi:hypothetical protein
MRSVCTMSRWIDPNGPWGLTTEQAQSVDNDTRIQSLLRARSQLKQWPGTKATQHSMYKKLDQIRLLKRIISSSRFLRLIKNPLLAVSTDFQGVDEFGPTIRQHFK